MPSDTAAPKDRARAKAVAGKRAAPSGAGWADGGVAVASADAPGPAAAGPGAEGGWGLVPGAAGG